jgi:8-oxo-dGTP diphosphatase
MAGMGNTAPGARPHLQVACAIIERRGLVLAAQRGAAMSLPLKWEFGRSGQEDAGGLPRRGLLRLGSPHP